MPEKMEKIHQEVFDLLMKLHKEDNTLLFTFRQINRKSRLEKGYWFLGDDKYLAVSFWRGRDWMTRMPSIAFTISVYGTTSLEFNAKDMNRYNYFGASMIKQVGAHLMENSFGYRKEYTEFSHKEYLKSLESFLKKDKKIIDDAILNDYAITEGENEADGRDELEFIFPADFNKQLKNVEKYQQLIKERHKTTGYLKEFSILNFGPIKELEIKNIPAGCKWIFLTGENGAGKTTILKALAAGLCNNNDHGDPVAKNFGNFEINIGIDSPYRTERFSINATDSIEDKKWIPKGLAVYGPVRLLTQGSLEDVFIHLDQNNISHKATFGLFNPIGILRDLSGNYVYSVRPKYYQMTLDDFLGNMAENLGEIMPNVYKVEVIPHNEGHKIIYFQGKENAGIAKEGTPFEKLPSGTRNFAALILDLLIRFSEQQENVDDPANFTGIVLIDEVDLHLHPIMQKEIIMQLADTFPKIQFVVTTHSPIPMLGAPKNSLFINVFKDELDEIRAKVLKIDITGYLPNAILTSPIFDFDDIINENHNPKDRLNTEDDYDEAVFYKILERKIKERTLESNRNK